MEAETESHPLLSDTLVDDSGYGTYSLTFVGPDVDENVWKSGRDGSQTPDADNDVEVESSFSTTADSSVVSYLSLQKSCNSSQQISIEEKSRFEKRRMAILVCLAVNNVFVMTCMYLLVPFYPQVAAKKKTGSEDQLPDAATSTAIGFVFSIFSFGEFLAAPVAGYLLPTSGPCTVLLLGGMLVSGVVLLLAFVNDIDDWSSFLLLSCLLRFFQGFGRGFIITTTLAVLPWIFPRHVTLVTGISRAMTGLGYAVGPLLAGGLYDVSGFRTPFLVSAGIMMLGTVLSLIIIPSSAGAIRRKQSSWNLLLDTVKAPKSLAWLVGVFLISTAAGSLDPTISPFLQETFHVTATEVGLIFILNSGVFSIAAPIAGVAVDRCRRISPDILLSCSFLAASVSFLFLGPWPATTLQPALWRSIICLGVFGASSGTAVTSVAPGLLHAMYNAGHRDSLTLHSSLGSVVSLFTALGIGVGPTVGGALAGEFGLPNTATLICVPIFAVACLSTAFSACSALRKRFQ